MWHQMRPSVAPIERKTEDYKSGVDSAGELYLKTSIRKMEVMAGIPVGQHLNLDELSCVVGYYAYCLLDREFKALRYYIIKCVVERMKNGNL